MKLKAVTLSFILSVFAFAQAEPPPGLDLPPPQTSGGVPLMQALKNRKTIREFKTEPVPLQILSDLLWSGFGVNRPETGHRTAPSAMNGQEILIYVTMEHGTFLYDAVQHRLKPHVEEDLRRKTGGQEFIATAPLALILVADHSRMPKARAEDRPFYSAFDAGCITQNIYLYCASAGLGAVVHDLDRGPLAKALQLTPTQSIIVAQSVGWPK